jgi:hypothetical protein
MAIEDITQALINIIVDFFGSIVFGGTKPSKKQSIAFWAVTFLIVAFLFWLTITFS